ncbi:lysophospholipid acyltransferase family protein [Burkholderia sp. BCCIQ04A]|uniref:Lysophospholipid acyltransferase family protein n=1 Tax=Burkholderia anthinoferrum TaxID=3090833 RepID=A0ABU5WYZ9_9BURK|nr:MULTISPECIES: lysophospholipid acyltransferase family protein [Burkholderia]MEB2507478.1 lysophospholipid acyltransferase family protein [Burkholderia anthinoferrum]MEB2534785.1 lysophospholipid acyltransferase family protein [Burkholderia anthinoferrum]MEB2565004.1 lysophospholipid acyltransferase family protein [Burkholderia anthinoferrum]MEB2583467.1 lysophospholipid acyltransferase family protein [Burkholderia anthinoferrum]MCA8103195.1 1-acyl-sn-glycerol-3-phosphate acyltransferase [Bu
MIAFRKLRLVFHLLRGMVIVALRFSHVTPAHRAELTRRWSVKMLRICGMRLVVHNDGARLDASALVVGNHVSWLDIYAVNAWRPTPFVSKAEVRQWPVVGWLAEKLDTVFLQREKRTEAMRIMHEMAERLRNGGVMCVFPEGTTSDGQDLLPFHANLFQSAVSAGCAVQPICLMYEDAHGRQSVAPAYTGDLSLGKSLDMVLRGGPLVAHLYVCEPIAPGGDRRATSAAARDAIATALAAMQEKVGKPTAESLAELQKHAYPATELGAGAAGEAAADAPVPGREG